MVTAINRCVDCGVRISYGALRCKPCRAKDTRKRNSTCVCQGCGDTYINKRHGTKGQGSKYCSRECSWRDSNGKKVGPSSPVRFNVCNQCGKRWVARVAKLFCSDKCRSASIQDSHRKSYVIRRQRKDRGQRPCKCCGGLFSPEGYGDKRRVFCSDACRSKYSNRIVKATRRARKRGARAEIVDPFIVFDRDGWRCQMCGKATPRKRRGTRHQNAPELDHRVPLSLGGEHSYANTQCACRKCNGGKQNKNSIGQLPLFNQYVTTPHQNL